MKKSLLCRKLGWCTWNAFYTHVTGEKVVKAVETLQNKHGIPIRWMILDDGWQDTTTPLDAAKDGEQWSYRLRSFKEHPDKFQSLSLKQTVRCLKTEHSIERVLVWHTLTGYWMGLDPTFFDAELQFPRFPRGIIHNDWSVSKEPSVRQGIGVPTDARRFMHEYHDYLVSCGVDGVKVDAQGVVGTLWGNAASETKESSPV